MISNRLICKIIIFLLIITSGCNFFTKNNSRSGTKETRARLVDKLNNAAKKNNINLKFDIYEETVLLIQNPSNMQSKGLDRFFKSNGENLKTVKKTGFKSIIIRSPETEQTISLYNISPDSK